MDIVLKLRELRRLRGYSQKDVARLTGVGDKTISSFETSARIGSMKLSQLSQLLRLYGFTEEQFFSRKIEELFDPDAIKERSREEQLIANLAELPTAARAALLERFELMLDSALTVSGAASPSIRLVEHRPARRSPRDGMRRIARDPFARHTLVRDVVRPLHAQQTCGFCGGIRLTPRARDPFLYRYGTEPDAIRPRVSWHDGIFCSKSCHDAYHDVA